MCWFERRMGRSFALIEKYRYLAYFWFVVYFEFVFILSCFYVSVPPRKEKASEISWVERRLGIKFAIAILNWHYSSFGLCSLITINSYYINSNILLITVNAIPMKSTRQSNREQAWEKIIQVLIRAALLKRTQRQEGKSVGLNICLITYNILFIR